MLSNTFIKTELNSNLYDIVEKKLQKYDISVINTCPLFLNNRVNDLYPDPFLNNYDLIINLFRKPNSIELYYTCFNCLFTYLATPDLIAHVSVKHQCRGCKIKSVNEKSFNCFFIQFCRDNFDIPIYDCIKLQYKPKDLKGKRFDIFVPHLNLYIEIDDSSHYAKNNQTNDLLKNNYVLNSGGKIIRIKIKNTNFDKIKTIYTLEQIINNETTQQLFHC